jgi:hypothetical protein
MGFMITWIGPIVAGFGMHLVAGKSRGRNARNAFRSASWGFWLLLLGNLAIFGPIHIPVIGYVINLVLLLTPAAICFLLAGASMLKEMRAQKESEFTDAA